MLKLSRVGAPDGSVKQGLLDTVLTEDMLDERGYATFTYQAYMPEAKDRTIAKRKISVKSWVYKFPEPRLNTKLKYTMIPSELTVSVSGVDVSYHGVVFTGTGNTTKCDDAVQRQ